MNSNSKILRGLYTLILFWILIFLSSEAKAFVHNIRADNVTAPCISCRTPINIPNHVAYQFSNTGTSDETNVKLFVIIKNPFGAIIYRDSVTVPHWLSNHSFDTSFKDFTPTMLGTYHFTGIAVLSTDENRSDDTMNSNVYSRYEADAAAISILEPQPNEAKFEKHSFRLSGTFQSVGVTDFFEMPVRVRITRCSDNILVFQSDTLMPEVYADSAPMKMVFPSKEGIYNVGALSPGCYKIAIIAR